MDSLSEQIVLGDELIPLIQEYLTIGKSIRYIPFRGRSMLPMLRQGKDAVELIPLPEKLKKYDLPVYRCPNGKYVMHRVIAVEKDHYVCLGDNTSEYELIKPEQMIALVGAFRRGNKRIQADAPMYRLYCCVWCFIIPIRRSLKRAKTWIGGRLRWKRNL